MKKDTQSETSLRPLTFDFENAGVVASLCRLTQQIRKRHAMPELPRWMTEACMSHVLCSGEGYDASPETTEEASEMVRRLSLLETEILGEGGTVKPVDKPVDKHADLKGASVVCIARLLWGACCEAFAAKQCSRICPHGERPRNDTVARKASQLYHDSSLVACWTSAHAQYFHEVESKGWAIAWPNIHSVACAPSEMDLSDLYARRASTRGVHSKDAVCMLSLLTRCTNPGARG